MTRSPEQVDPAPAPGCAKVEACLSSFLDGELARVEEEKVRAHLAACNRCCQLATDLAALIGMLHCFGSGGCCGGSGPRNGHGRRGGGGGEGDR